MALLEHLKFEEDVPVLRKLTVKYLKVIGY